MIRRCHHRETLLPIPSWSSPFLRCSPVHWHQSLRRSFGVTTDEDSFTTVCLGATVCKHGALVDLCRSGFPGAGESIGIRASKFHAEDGHKKRGGIPIAPSGTEVVAWGKNTKRHQLHRQVPTSADCCERFSKKRPRSVRPPRSVVLMRHNWSNPFLGTCTYGLPNHPRFCRSTLLSESAGHNFSNSGGHCRHSLLTNAIRAGNDAKAATGALDAVDATLMA